MVVLLLLSIGLGSLLAVAIVSNNKSYPKSTVPIWSLGITTLVVILGIMISGTILGQGSLNIYLLGYIGFIGVPLLILGNQRFSRHYWRWVLVITSPIIALYLSRCWVDLQTYQHRDTALAILQPQIEQWNQQSDLGNELQPNINKADVIIYRWDLHTKRIGITNINTGQVEFLVKFKPHQTPPQIKQVTRVDYLTSGSLMVWPSR